MQNDILKIYKINESVARFIFKNRKIQIAGLSTERGDITIDPTESNRIRLA